MQLPSRFLGQRGIFLCDYKHQDFQFSPDGKLAKFGDPLFLILLINYFCFHLSTSSDPRSTIYDPTSISLDPTYQVFLTPHQLYLNPPFNYFWSHLSTIFWTHLSTILIPLINYIWSHLSTSCDPTCRKGSFGSRTALMRAGGLSIEIWQRWLVFENCVFWGFIFSLGQCL